jgi:energy-coupling factor transporter transmembrane protein EcfT
LYEKLNIDYHFICGIISVTVVTGNHLYYLYLSIKRKIKPHVFTLGVYIIVTISVALGMSGEGALGPGFRLALPALLYFLMIFFSAKQGVDYISRSDVVMLSLATLGLPLWWLTDNPRVSILFLAAVEGFGFAPALRKAYRFPNEDSALAPLISAFAMLFGALSVKNPLTSWATTFYFFYWLLLCFILTFVILVRRKSLELVEAINNIKRL